MFPSSNSKDGCFSGKRCMVQLLQGMIILKKERWLILLTKLSNNGIINYEKKKRGKV